jgi:hypothetical protein
MAAANNNNTSWQDSISDPKERRVFEGLANPAWDFRTIGGLARETKLSEDDVASTLHKYPSLVRESLVRDLKGDELFTLNTRPVKAREILALVRDLVAKSVS